MIGTVNCVYETPCGWCSKWDKRCDKVIAYTTINVDKPIKVNKSTCDHEWENYGLSTASTQYICQKCGKIETRPTEYTYAILS